MDNPNGQIEPGTADHLSLNSSDSDAEYDNDQDNPDNTDIPLPFIVHVPTKAERTQYKQADNAELMRLTRQMLAHGGNLNSALNFGRWTSNTLLTAAAEHNCHRNVLEFALANGADPNGADKRGNTPLKVAVTSYRPENISLLLARGAQLNDQSLLGSICSPLGIKQMNPKRITTLKALLDAGANPNLAVLRPLYKSAHTPCLLSLLLCNPIEKLEGGAYDAFVAHHKAMIDLLLEAKLNLFKKDGTGKTDWEKIQECNTTYKKYDPELFNYVQTQVTIRAHQYSCPLQP